MADLVVVMGEGRSARPRSPIEIYRKPADAFVADFIGSTNLLDVTADGADAPSILGQAIPGLALPAGVTKASVSIRPEDVQLAAPGERRDRRHGDLRARPRRHHRDLRRGRRTDHRRRGTPRERPDVAAGQTGRRRAAAGKLRGAEAMRREAPQIDRRLHAAALPGADADRLLRRALLDDDRGELLQARSGRLLHAGLRLRQLRPLPRRPSSPSVLGFSLMLAVAGRDLLRRRRPSPSPIC